MVRNNGLHPKPDRLRTFTLGRLSDEGSAAIENHLAECVHCHEVLAGLNDEDAFQTMLKGLRVREPNVAANAAAVPLELQNHSRYRILGVPFPTSRSREEWKALLDSLYKRWGGRWSNPGLGGLPIKVGILHSLTGTMAVSEKSVVDATLVAIEEINERGGVLGRPVEGVVEDGASDGPTFARLADKLITKGKVCTVFGCWTSASRKEVKQIVEKHDHLLFYPVQYEGLEQSPNIVYTGAAPNQQILPAVKWCCTFLEKKRLFLVGSDYIFPRCANKIIEREAEALGGKVVGLEYLSQVNPDVTALAKKIAAADPDIIVNTINGDSNLAFFRALRAEGITPEKIPTISFSITEEELLTLNAWDVVGDFAAWNYFMTINSPQNDAFIKHFQTKYGGHRLTSDAMEAAYFGVHLWAHPVQAAGSTDKTDFGMNCMLSRHRMREIGPVEALESRTLLTGNLNVTVVDGIMTIAGDDASHSATLRRNLEFDYLELVGADGTTINGSAAPFEYDEFALRNPLEPDAGLNGPVLNLSINLQGGNDSLTISMINFGGSYQVDGPIQINGAEGDDRIKLDYLIATESVEIDGGT